MAAVTVGFDAPPAHALHPFDGVGAQFNTNLFTEDGQPQPLTDAQRAALADTVANLRPGHSRIFVDRRVRPDATGTSPAAKQLAALVRSVELAHAAGANVNLTYWGQGPYASEAKLRELAWPNPTIRTWPQPGKRKWPDELTSGAISAPGEAMARFAAIVAHLRHAGLGCVTHLTIQNEVNGSSTDLAHQHDQGLSMRLYEWLYRLLDTSLRALPDPLQPGRTLRETVQIVGGDLVEAGNSHQDAWLEYMRANMDLERDGFPSVIDGYSVHIYWDPGPGKGGFPAKLERRLSNLAATLARLGIDKPVYVTEYGVKRNGGRPEPGIHGGGPLEFSVEAAFQHAWFNALAPQHGCSGLAKWTLCRTDKPGGWGQWGMIGVANPAAGGTPFERSPSYRVTRLFNHLVGRGWKAAGLGRAAGGNVLASRFAGDGHDSVAVLNAADTPLEVTLRGLRAGAQYIAADWNRDGHGQLHPVPTARPSAPGGTASVTVPAHGVVALSTRPLDL